MIQLTKTYPNGVLRIFTVESHVVENGTATLQTAESGAVIISAADTPDLWAQLMQQTEGG